MPRTVYFEDLQEGDVQWGDEVVVDREEMLAYNRANDPWPFHVDEEAAAATPFGGIIASGGFTITLMYRSAKGIYNNEQVTWAFLGGLDWKVRFPKPVRPGSRLRCRSTILETRFSSKPGRGVLRSLNEMIDQGGDVALSIDIVSFLATRSV